MSYEKKFAAYHPSLINSYGPGQASPYGPNSLGNFHSRNSLEANSIPPEGFGSGFSKKKEYSGGYDYSDKQFLPGEMSTRISADFYGSSVPGSPGYIDPENPFLNKY